MSWAQGSQPQKCLPDVATIESCLRDLAAGGMVQVEAGGRCRITTDGLAWGVPLCGVLAGPELQPGLSMGHMLSEQADELSTARGESLLTKLRVLQGIYFKRRDLVRLVEPAGNTQASCSWPLASGEPRRVQ